MKLSAVFTRNRVMLLLLGLLLLAGPTTNSAQQSETARTPQDILRAAQTIYVRSNTIYLKAAALEEALLDRAEVQAWGFALSRNEGDTDLIIEVDRKRFTNRFVYSVLDARTNHVLLAGNVGSLGGSVEGQIANGFVKRLQKVRPLSAQK